MNNFTEIFLDSSDTENMPSNSLNTTYEHNDNQRNDPLNDVSYITPKPPRNLDRNMIKHIYQNTIEIKQSLKDITIRIEQLEESNKKMHTRQLTELIMTQKLIKPRKETPILKTPINSVEEFKQLEDNVKKSHELSKKIEDEIFNQQGSDPSKFIRFIWRKIMDDNVASHFCWKGTPKKEAIEVMAVTNAFRGAFNRKFVGSNKEFSRASAKWFQTAKDRILKKSND